VPLASTRCAAPSVSISFSLPTAAMRPSRTTTVSASRTGLERSPLRASPILRMTSLERMGDSLLFISHGSPHKAIKEQFSEIYVSIQRAIGQQWISFHERDGLALPAEQKEAPPSHPDDLVSSALASRARYHGDGNVPAQMAPLIAAHAAFAVLPKPVTSYYVGAKGWCGAVALCAHPAASNDTQIVF
jgi:hypothetical protein